VDHLAVVEFEPLASSNFKPVGVEAQLMQDRRVNIRHIVSVGHGVKAQLVRSAMLDATPNASARQPGAESLRMMITPGTLGAGRSSKFGSKDNQRVVQQAALFQILKQACDRLIHLTGQLRVIRLDARMRIPFTTPPPP